MKTKCCDYDKCKEKAEFTFYPEWRSMLNKIFHFCPKHSKRADSILNSKNYSFKKVEGE